MDVWHHVNRQVPAEAGDWFAEGHGPPTVWNEEPLVYVRLTTNPDVFANVPLRFLDERVEWSIPGDKCATVVISHYWKGTDVCVKRAPHVCLAVLAEVKTEQGVMNSPAAPAAVTLPGDDLTKPYTITSDL